MTEITEDRKIGFWKGNNEQNMNYPLPIISLNKYGNDFIEKIQLWNNDLINYESLISPIWLRKIYINYNLNSQKLNDLCEKYPLAIVSYYGYSFCRLCPLKENGDSEVHWTAPKSQRKWIFPTGYFHYILEHNIEIPEEFLLDILENEKPNILYDKNDRGILDHLFREFNIFKIRIGMLGLAYSA